MWKVVATFEADKYIRWLVSWIVDSLAKRCVAIEDAGLKELLETSRESLGTACQFNHVVDIMVGIEGVGPRYILIQWIYGAGESEMPRRKATEDAYRPNSSRRTAMDRKAPGSFHSHIEE